jgi:hypothetical protein
MVTVIQTGETAVPADRYSLPIQRRTNPVAVEAPKDYCSVYCGSGILCGIDWSSRSYLPSIALDQHGISAGRMHSLYLRITMLASNGRTILLVDASGRNTSIFGSTSLMRKSRRGISAWFVWIPPLNSPMGLPRACSHFSSATACQASSAASGTRNGRRDSRGRVSEAANPVTSTLTRGVS